MGVGEYVMKLRDKQQRFADYYIETGNITESAIKAGYSKNYANAQGYKLLENVGIKTYINKKMKELADKRIMGAREALELLTSIARGELIEELYLPTEKGIERIEKIPDIKDRQKALESILKRYPMNKHDELKEKLLEAQIDKTNAETENIKKDEGNKNTIIHITDRWADDE